MSKLYDAIERDSRTEIAAIDEKISDVKAMTVVSQEQRLSIERWLSGLYKSKKCWEDMLVAVTP